MTYQVKSPILGFENISEVELNESSELFSTLKSSDDAVAFTLVNPYMLREYSFDVPRATQVLLGLNDAANVRVYNVAVLQEPLEDSKVDFLAPLVFNTENNTMAQVVLDPKRHPEFDFAESIKAFRIKGE